LVHEDLVKWLEADGFLVHYDPKIAVDQVEAALPECHGIVINSKIKMDSKRIDLGRNLKFIARLGSGLEVIDIDHAKSKGIAVMNSPEGNRDAVAEHAIGMLLVLLNNILIAHQETKAFQWHRERNRGVELGGKTLGIIGFGNTGQALAKKLSTWDVKLLVYDKYATILPSDWPNAEIVEIDDICQRSDILSLHLPLTDETFHFVNHEFLQKCKKSLILINTSRGQVVHTESLIAALESGHLLGACLDVFENEKVETYNQIEKDMYTRLFNFQQVVVTPHIAGWTKESLWKIAHHCYRKIKTVV